MEKVVVMTAFQSEGNQPRKKRKRIQVIILLPETVFKE